MTRIARRYKAGSFIRRRIGPNRLRVISDGVAGLEKVVSVVHLEQPARTADRPLVHRVTEEFVYVLKGHVTAVVGSRKIPLDTGDVLYLPAGMPHYFQTGRSRVEVLCLFLPGMDLKAPDIHSCEEDGAMEIRRLG